MAEKASVKTENKAPERQVKVKFNTDKLSSSYANFCHVTSTREEVVLNFGVNSDWDRSTGEIEIDLTNRLILSPFAAKRLMLMINSLIDGYEKKYSPINIDGVPANATASK